MSFILLFLSFFPIILLGLYIYKKDTEKEPKSLLFRLFTSGFLATAIVIIVNLIFLYLTPALYVSNNINNFNFFKLFFLVFLEIGFIEEGSKWIMVKIFGYKNKEFDQLYDIIVYSVFVALGFAAIENVIYVLEGGLATGIYRAIFSVPSHAAFGIIMGYFLGLAKMSKTKIIYWKNITLSIFIPALLHTLYDFCLMAEKLSFLLIFVGFIIILYTLAYHKIDEFIRTKVKINYTAN